MKNLFQILFLLFSAHLTAQTVIVGGGNMCKVNGDPDANPALARQDQRYECSIAWDTLNNKLYTYRASDPVGTRWDELTVSGSPLTAGLGVVISGDTIRNTGDLSNTNELQALVVAANSVTLSGSGGSVTIAGAGGITPTTAGTTITLTGTVPTGAETKVNQGSGIGVTGAGTTGSPYVVTNSGDIDGSGTKINAGANITVSGAGTIVSPYVIVGAGGGSGVSAPVQEALVGTGSAYTSSPALVASATQVGVRNNSGTLAGHLKIGDATISGKVGDFVFDVNSTSNYRSLFNLTDSTTSWGVGSASRNHQLLGPTGRNRMNVDNNGFLLLGAQGTYPKIQLPMAYSGMRHTLLAANAPDLGEGQHLILGCNYPGIEGYNSARNSLSFNIEVFDDDGLTYYNESYMSFKRATTGASYRPWAFKFNEAVPYPAAGGPVTVVNQFMGQTIFTAATKSEAELGISGAVVAMMIDTSNTGSATTGGLVSMGASTTRNQSKLEVSANDAVNSTLKLLTSNSAIHPRIGFSFDNGVNTKEYAEVGMIPIDGTVGAEAGSLEFKTRNTGTLAQRMTILYDGKVGVGTGSPSQLLHVAGNTRITGAIYDSSNDPGSSGQVLSSTVTGTDWITPSTGSTYSAGTGIDITSNVISVQGTPGWGFYGDATTGKLANSFNFQHNGKNTQLGNTGLPTKTRLDVYSSSTLNPNMLLLSDGADLVTELGMGYLNDTAKVSYSRLATTAVVGTLGAETGYFEVKTRNAGTDVLAARFDNGKVGVGGTSTARTLTVTGEARVTDLTTDAPTRFVGADADGDLGQITLGSGFSLPSGVLTYTPATSGTVTSVAATAPAAGFTISGSPITGSGTLGFTLANDLAALEAMSGTGVVVRTASETYANRTITAGTGISIADGNGVSGNPTITNTGDTNASDDLTGSGTADYVARWTGALSQGIGVLRDNATNASIGIAPASALGKFHITGGAAASLPGLYVSGYENNAPNYTGLRFDFGATSGIARAAFALRANGVDAAGIGVQSVAAGNGNLILSTSKAGAMSEWWRVDSMGNMVNGALVAGAAMHVNRTTGYTTDLFKGQVNSSDKFYVQADGDGYFSGDLLVAGAAASASTGLWGRSAIGELVRVTLGTNLSYSGNTLNATGGGSTALSAITDATGTNTIDSDNFTQTWNWSTADNETPMVFTANALTTGTLQQFSSSNNSLNSTEGIVTVKNNGSSTSGAVFSVFANSTAGRGMYVRANGRVGVNRTDPISTLNVNGVGYFGSSRLPSIESTLVGGVDSSDFRYSTSIENRMNTSGAHATLYAKVGGTSGGDPATVYDVPGGASWSVGIDNSDGDRLKFSANQSVGTTSVLEMLSSGVSAVVLDRTVTAGGTTGAQTINKMAGTVNFAAGASTLVVTNSLVTTSSIIIPVIRTNDTTATIKNIVAASGSFTITLTAAATAETSVGFAVFN